MLDKLWLKKYKRDVTQFIHKYIEHRKKLSTYNLKTKYSINETLKYIHKNEINKKEKIQKDMPNLNLLMKIKNTWKKI